MNEFDPSRAQAGVWNRTKWNGQIKHPELLDEKPTWKYAEEAQLPPDPAVPQFPEPKPGGHDPSDNDREVDTDLNVHSAPNPKSDKVRGLIKQLRANVINKEKDLLQKKVEQQNKEYKDWQEQGSDIEESRKGENSGVPNMRKGASSPLEELANQEANPIRLMLILDTDWGPQWKEWEAETIVGTAEVDIARVNMDKLMAIKNLVNTDEFWKDPMVFSKVCLAFAGRIVDWGHVQEPRLHEIASCVSLVERYIKEQDFSGDVAAFVAASAIRDGYMILPPVLSFADGPFSVELAMNVGDEVVEKQKSLMRALETEDAEILNTEDAVQYMRLLRCQYHTQDMIDKARA